MTYYLPFGPEIQLGQHFGDNPNWGPNPAGGHNGDDWLTPIGTPVRSPGNGTVLYAGRFDSTYLDNWGWNINYAGPMVILNMDGADGPYFEFGHLSKLLVSTGQRVVAGQVIALTGADDGGTGVITGPHCHVGCLPPNFNLGTNTYGRVNPRLYMTRHWDGVTIDTQSTPEEDTLSAAEAAQIKKHITAQADRVIGYVGQIMVSGYAVGDKSYPGDAMVGITTQNRVNATLALVQQLVAAKTGLTPEQVTEAVKKGLAEGVTVTVTGAK